MIHGRFGDEVTIVRLARLEDVRALDCRKPDAADREALSLGAYVVTRSASDGQLRLAHIAYLRADGGLGEIEAAIRAADPEVRS